MLDQQGRDESHFAAVAPDAVVVPHSKEEVAAMMHACAAHGVPVIPFGMGSSVEGSATRCFRG